MRLAKQFAKNSEFATDAIVWNNLYKVADSSEGNPSGGLINVQFETAKRILKQDIEYHKPKVVIFLTGWNWAEPFLNDLVEEVPNVSGNFVEFAGKYKNTIVIVGKHPQGKPEAAHTEEIIKIYDLIK